MQLLGSHIRLRHQSVVAPRLHARCSAQHPDSAHGVPLPVDEGSIHKVTQQPTQRPWLRVNRRLLLVQTALSLAACPCCVAPASADQDGEWDYGPHGPSSWPGACKAGEAQSPVDIPMKARAAAAGQRGDLDLQYSQTGDLELEYSTTSPNGQRGDLKLKYTQKDGQRGDLNVQYSQTPRGELKLHYSQNSAAGQRGDLNLKFSQTPVAGQRGDLELQYSQPSGATVKNNGHGALQVNVPKGNYCMLGGRKLELVQYHFHTPSEHTFDGAGTAMEAHLVHKDVSTGQFTVLAALMQVGAGDSIGALQSALQHGTGEAGVSSPINEAVHPEQLVPSPVDGHRPFVRYPGSLTTPPCSEPVQWVVFADKLTIPPKQLAAYKKLMAPSGYDKTGNSRPVQALQGRQLEYCWL